MKMLAGGGLLNVTVNDIPVICDGKYMVQAV